MFGDLLKKFNVFGGKNDTPQGREGGDVAKFYTDRVKNEQLRRQIEAISKSRHNEFATEKFETPHGTAALKAVYDKEFGIWNLFEILELEIDGTENQRFYGATHVFFNALYECSAYGAGRALASPEAKGIDGLPHWSTAAKAANQIIDKENIVQPTADNCLLTEYTVSYDKKQKKVQSAGIASAVIDDLTGTFRSMVAEKPVSTYVPYRPPEEVHYTESSGGVAAIFQKLRIEAQYGSGSPQAKLAQAELDHGKNSPEAKLARAEVQYGSDSPQMRELRKSVAEEIRKREEQKKAAVEAEKKRQQNLERERRELEIRENVEKVIKDSLKSHDSSIAMVLAKDRIIKKYGQNSEEFKIIDIMVNGANAQAPKKRFGLF